jgi:hypothetical protein
MSAAKTLPERQYDRIAPVLTQVGLRGARGYISVFTSINTPYVADITWPSEEAIVAHRLSDVAVPILDVDNEAGMVGPHALRRRTEGRS